MQVLFDMPNFSCIMQLRAENQNLVSALSNYQQILYQFFEFTQNLKQSQEYQDNTDRIEVERTFSLSKRCYGMDCITTKLEETQLTSIALSVFVTNLFKIQKRIFFTLFPLFQFWDKLIRGRSLGVQMAA